MSITGINPNNAFWHAAVEAGIKPGAGIAGRPYMVVTKNNKGGISMVCGTILGVHANCDPLPEGDGSITTFRLLLSCSYEGGGPGWICFDRERNGWKRESDDRNVLFKFVDQELT